MELSTVPALACALAMDVTAVAFDGAARLFGPDVLATEAVPILASNLPAGSPKRVLAAEFKAYRCKEPMLRGLAFSWQFSPKAWAPIGSRSGCSEMPAIGLEQRKNKLTNIERFATLRKIMGLVAIRPTIWRAL
jgi:hypothetical protein